MAAISERDRLAELEADVRELRQALTTRRGLFAAAAASAVGAGVLARSTPASAATGGNCILGQVNEADRATTLSIDDPAFTGFGPGPIALVLDSPGGHLRFVGTPGDFVMGTYPAGTLAYNSSSGLEIWQDDGTGNDRPTLLARPGTAGAFTLLPQPQRVFDSRPGALPDLPYDGRISSGQTREVGLLDSNAEAFSENVDGVMINLTITNTINSGYLSLYSAGLTSPPATSTINWSESGQTVANLAVSASEFARVKVTCGGGGSTHFIIDVIGTYG